MKRAAFAVMSTLAGLVVLLGVKTVPAATSPATAVAPGATSGTTATSGTASGSTGSSGSSSTGSGAAQTVTGQAYSTRYGDVQVQVTVVGTEITHVTPVTLPSGNPRDTQINAAAAPVLEQEVIAAQSADVQMVSGATYTSTGYVKSLQSALDQVPALTTGQG